MKTLATTILFAIGNILYSNPILKEAEQFVSEGDSLLIAGKISESIAQYDRALSIFEEEEAWNDYVSTLNKKTEGLWRGRQYATADSLITTILDLLTSKIRDSSKFKLNQADALNNRSVILALGGAFAEAHQHILKAKNLYEEVMPNSEKLATAYNRVAWVLGFRSQFNEALPYYLKSLDMMKEISGEENLQVAKLYNNIGETYRSKGDYEKALDYGVKSLELKTKILGDNHTSLAASINNVGTIYFHRGEFHRALTYYQKALKIRRDIEGEQSFRVAQSYNNIGVIYYELDRFQEAIKYQTRSLEIRKSLFQGLHPILTSNYTNLGNVYEEMRDFPMAIKNHLEALRITKATLESNHIETALAYTNLAIALFTNNQYEHSIAHADSALSIYRIRFGEKHPYMAVSFNIKAMSLLELDRFDLAQEITEAAIASNTYSNELSESPDLLNVAEVLVLIKSLRLSAKILERKFLHSSDYNDLKASLDILLSTSQIIDNARSLIVRYEDKFELGEIAQKMYQQAVDLCLKIHDHNQDESMLASLFYFSEKMKAAALLDNIQSNDAKRFTDIPPTLLAFENKLKVDINYYKSNLIRTHKESSDKTHQLDQYEGKLYHARQSLDSLLEYFEKEYPKYFNLKMQDNFRTANEIQNALSGNQALLEYVEGEDQIHALLITNQSLQVFAVNKIDIEVLIEKITDQLQERSLTQLKPADYESVAFELYSKLMSEGLSKLVPEVNQLIIVPTARLSMIPWEILINSRSGTSFKNLSYLFRQYAISYAYSASILFNDHFQKEKPSKTFLGFAPGYATVNSELNQTLREALVPLKWNVPEVSGINEFFDGEVLTETEATERNFKKQAPDYQVLHLAMHALIDQDESMKSKLVFTQNNDSIEDGMLHTFELFNMNLPAEMVVLSACNTGIGEIQEGEGVMSLARAFAYAGAPSLVMSHWNVNDQSTAKLMTSYYKHLAQGERKDEALRNAKLDFLKEANEFQAHPFFWGGFVIVGDTSPLQQSKNWNWIIMVLAILSGVIALVVYLKRK